MFLLTKPYRTAIDNFIARARETSFTYPNLGDTRDDTPNPNGFIVDHNSVQIGNGEADFERAKQAIRAWKMFDMPWVQLCWPDTPIEEDRTVAILIRHFGFYSLNAARIVYAINESNCFGFAYGTLESHGESGEERFSIRLDGVTGDVEYDLYAFSRPNYLSARLVYPFTRRLQQRFATDSKAAMLHAIRTLG